MKAMDPVLKTVVAFAAVITLISGMETNCRMLRIKTSGKLICEFSKDVSKEKYNFVVQRYDLHNNNTKAERIVNCNWLPQGLTCTNNSDYLVDKEVRHVLVVDIPRLTKRHEGRYVCQVLNNGEENDNFCVFEYKGNDESEIVSSTSPTLDKTVACTGTDSVLDHTAVIIAGMFAFVFVICVVIVTLVYAFVIHKRQHRTHVNNAQQCCNHRSGDELQQVYSFLTDRVRFFTTDRVLSQNEPPIQSRRQFNGGETTTRYDEQPVPRLLPLTGTYETSPLLSLQPQNHGISEHVNGDDERHRMDETPSISTICTRKEPVEEMAQSRTPVVSTSDKNNDEGDVDASLAPEEENARQARQRAAEMSSMSTSGHERAVFKGCGPPQRRRTRVHNAQQSSSQRSGVELQQVSLFPTNGSSSQKEPLITSRHQFDGRHNIDVRCDEYGAAELVEFSELVSEQANRNKERQRLEDRTSQTSVYTVNGPEEEMAPPSTPDGSSSDEEDAVDDVDLKLVTEKTNAQS